jgi:hypothetical protein
MRVFLPLLMAGLLAVVGCAASGQGTSGDGGFVDSPSEEGGGQGAQNDGGGGGGAGGGVVQGDSGAHGGDAAMPFESGTSETGTTTEGGAGGCAGLPLCDDFDEYTAGVAPPAPNWSLVLGCNASQATDGPATGGGLMIQVDSSQHHSGANSVRVVGGDSCGDYFVNTTAFAKVGTQLYARFWVMFSGPPTPDHSGFLSMYSGPMVSSAIAAYSNTPQLRLGTQGSVVVWNSTINGADSTLPDIDSTGEAASVAPVTMQWSCIEFHLDQTNANIEFRFQASETSAETTTDVPGLSYDGTSTSGVSDTWKSSGPTSLELQSFGLGWLDVSGADYTMWFDDVALSGDTWIGCD